jgi:hypothetical protein
MTDGSGLAAEIERENDGRIGDLKLSVVRFDLCRFHLQDLPVLLNRGGKVFYAEGNVKRVDDTVRDNDIDRIVRQRNLFDLTLEKLDIFNSGLALILVARTSL